jgi:hypothetical protein
MAAWFAVLCVALGFLSGKASTGVLGVSLLSVGFSLGVLVTERAGLVTSAGTASRRRRAMTAALAISVTAAVATIVWLAAAGSFPFAVGAASCAIGAGCVVVTLLQVLR